MKSLNLDKLKNIKNLKNIDFKNIDFREILDKIITHLRLVVTIAAVVIIVSFGIFLYKDFYLTIISAQKIVLLEGEVSATAIDGDALKSVEQKHEQKKSLKTRDWYGYNQIFYKTDSPITPSNEPVVTDEPENNDIEVIDFLQEEDVSPVTSF